MKKIGYGAVIYRHPGKQPLEDHLGLLALEANEADPEPKPPVPDEMTNDRQANN